MPVQAPVTHVWLVHVAGDPHAPIELQVSTPLLTHSVEPLAHTPWHEAVPEPCTQVLPEQATGMPQLPPVHCCTPLPEHWLVPAEQDPEHAPLMQVPVEQGTPVPHWPFVVHVCTPPDESHCVWPGVHTPHDPPEHTVPEHAAGELQLPLESHVCW
jgi:hypothetical protein